MKILIAPNSRPLRNGQRNAKEWNHWPQLIQELEKRGHTISFVPPKCSMKEVEELTSYCNIYICVDTFLQHVGHYLGKKGIVIWTVSDPLLFGYKDNINLIKDRAFLRPNQYDTWENTPHNPYAHVSVEEVLKAVENYEHENNTSNTKE